MRILLDMDLSAEWVAALRDAGFDHWSSLGAPNASDDTIFRHAEREGFVLVTMDLDFTAIPAKHVCEGSQRRSDPVE